MKWHCGNAGANPSCFHLLVFIPFRYTAFIWHMYQLYKDHNTENMLRKLLKATRFNNTVSANSLINRKTTKKVHWAGKVVKNNQSKFKCITVVKKLHLPSYSIGPCRKRHINRSHPHGLSWSHFTQAKTIQKRREQGWDSQNCWANLHLIMCLSKSTRVTWTPEIPELNINCKWPISMQRK